MWRPRPLEPSCLNAQPTPSRRPVAPQTKIASGSRLTEKRSHNPRRMASMFAGRMAASPSEEEIRHLRRGDGSHQPLPLYRHQDRSDLAKDPLQHPHICPNVARGEQCEDRDSCSYFHSVTEMRGAFLKTRFCRYWRMSASCPYQMKCTFAHSKEDLRPLGDVVAKQLRGISQNAEAAGKARNAANRRTHRQRVGPEHRLPFDLNEKVVPHPSPAVTPISESNPHNSTMSQSKFPSVSQTPYSPIPQETYGDFPRGSGSGVLPSQPNYPFPFSYLAVDDPHHPRSLPPNGPWQQMPSLPSSSSSIPHGGNSGVPVYYLLGRPPASNVQAGIEPAPMNGGIATGFPYVEGSEGVPVLQVQPQSNAPNEQQTPNNSSEGDAAAFGTPSFRELGTYFGKDQSGSSLEHPSLKFGSSAEGHGSSSMDSNAKGSLFQSSSVSLDGPAWYPNSVFHPQHNPLASYTPPDSMDSIELCAQFSSLVSAEYLRDVSTMQRYED